MVDIKEWITGRASKEVYRKTLIGVSVLIICTFLFSIIFYPGDFSFLTTQVSSLGGFRPESLGYYMFTIGFVTMGILLIPHGLYLFRSLKSDLGLFGHISFFLLITACLGIIGVGLFPMSFSRAVHWIAAGMAFGGIAIGMVFLIGPLRGRIKRGAKWPTNLLIIALFSPLIITAILTIVIVGVPVVGQILNNQELNEPDIWALFEWLLVFSSMYWFIGIVYTFNPE